jgi:hypothetical protein
LSSPAKDLRTGAIPKRRSLRRGFVAGALVSLLVVLGCVGAVYQRLAINHDKKLNPLPGLLIDVGGYRMHVYCIGQYPYGCVGLRPRGLVAFLV